MEKKKVVLMLSKAFPKRMSNAGEPTNFAEKLSSGEKKHTIRANLAWWKKKADNGKVCRTDQSKLRLPDSIRSVFNH